MRDFLTSYADLSLATKDTPVSSADNSKFDAINTKSRFTQYQSGHMEGDLMMCFQPTADFASGDDFIPFIEDSADGSSFAAALTGKQVGAPALASRIYRIPFPKEHRQFVRPGATPKSTGTFAAKTVKVWVEWGVQED